jgi:hypothetical protein
MPRLICDSVCVFTSMAALITPNKSETEVLLAHQGISQMILGWYAHCYRTFFTVGSERYGPSQGWQICCAIMHDDDVIMKSSSLLQI